LPARAWRALPAPAHTPGPPVCAAPAARIAYVHKATPPARSSPACVPPDRRTSPSRRRTASRGTACFRNRASRSSPPASCSVSPGWQPRPSQPRGEDARVGLRQQQVEADGVEIDGAATVAARRPCVSAAGRRVRARATRRRGGPQSPPRGRRSDERQHIAEEHRLSAADAGEERRREGADDQRGRP
jgi:hypothetical protein